MISLSTRHYLGIVTLLGLIATAPPALAQPPNRGEAIVGAGEPVEVRYGSILKAEFNRPNSVHLYALKVRNEKDRVKISIKPSGEILKTGFALFDPGDVLIDSAPHYPSRSDSSKRVRGFLRSSNGLPSPSITTSPLSARGIYSIQVFNGEKGGLGTYQIMIEAILPSGKVIKPGDKDPDDPEAAEETEGKKTSTEKEPGARSPNFFGFAGLAAVDFSSAEIDELPASGMIREKIVSDQDRIVRGYTYTSKSAGSAEVTLKRTKGSGSLGFVVLSASKEVLAQSILTVSDQVTTTIPFPAGASTLGIYRLDEPKAKTTGSVEFELQVKRSAAGR